MQRLWQEIHGQLKSVLPPNDSHKGKLQNYSFKWTSREIKPQSDSELIEIFSIYILF
jgi:hypothetical protein